MEELRSLARELWPHREPDNFRLSDNEIAIVEHFNRLRRADRKRFDQLEKEFRRHTIDHMYSK